mmetsp:Transcript_4301/g.7699  ORF Transcript_4301/g.7699 Transcript_4301/m.7699 type:complete len:110 (-) Transcript_4301:1118-1447(-)
MNLIVKVFSPHGDPAVTYMVDTSILEATSWMKASFQLFMRTTARRLVKKELHGWMTIFTLQNSNKYSTKHHILYDGFHSFVRSIQSVQGSVRSIKIILFNNTATAFSTH